MRIKIVSQVFIWSVLTLIIKQSKGEDWDASKPTDRSGWVDPGDMFSYDPSTKSHRKSIGKQSHGNNQKDHDHSNAEDHSKTDECTCNSKMPVEQCPIKGQSTLTELAGNDKYTDLALVLLKRHVNFLVENIKIFNANEGRYLAKIRMNQEYLKIFKEFVSSDKPLSAQVLANLDEVFTYMFEDFVSDTENMGKYFSSTAFQFNWSTEFTSNYWPLIISIFCILWLIGNPKNVMKSFKARLLILVLTITVISIYMKWKLIVQELQANHQAQISTIGDRPPECDPSSMGFLTWFWSKTKNIFSDDPCKEYYKTLGVDPTLNATPLNAIFVAIADVAADLFERIMKTFGKGLRLFSSELTLWALLTMIPILILFVGLLKCHYIFAPLKWFWPSKNVNNFIREAVEDIDKKDTPRLQEPATPQINIYLGGNSSPGDEKQLCSSCGNIVACKDKEETLLPKYDASSNASGQLCHQLSGTPPAKATRAFRIKKVKQDFDNSISESCEKLELNSTNKLESNGES